MPRRSRKRPQQFSLQFSLAALHESQNNREKAQAVYRQITELNDAGAHGLEARTKLARLDLEQAIGADSRDLRARMALAGVLTSQGDFPAAKLQLKEVLEVQPGYANALQALARTQIRNQE